MANSPGINPIVPEYKNLVTTGLLGIPVYAAVPATWSGASLIAVQGGTQFAPTYKYYIWNGSAFVEAAGFPTGGIIMWSGTTATIPTGWALCDGSGGTPDLRQKFIYGATADGGALPVGSTGGSTTHTHAGHSNHVFTQPSAHGVTDAVIAAHTVTQPNAHVFTQPSAHVITQPALNNHVFTQPSDHPAHNHPVNINVAGTTAKTRSATMTGAGSFTASFSFTVAASSGTVTSNVPTDGPINQTNGAALTLTHTGGGVDAHSLSTQVALSNNHSGGGVDAHSGTAVSAHSLTSGVSLSNNHAGGGVDAHSAHDSPLNVPPYYALAFIMKL